jgi:hypothetical protein
VITSKRILIDSSSDSCSLTIQGITKKDEGKYTCNVTAKGGAVSCEAKLTIGSKYWSVSSLCSCSRCIASGFANHLSWSVRKYANFRNKNLSFCSINSHMPNTLWLICQRKLLQIPAGESRRLSMRGLPVSRGSVPHVYCRRFTHCIVHYCVGDIMPTRYE